MRPETLQSLSFGLVFMGLFIAALGGFGAFHFGKRLDGEQEQHRTAAVQTLAEVVSTLREEQRGLLNRVATVEETVTEPATPLLAAISTTNSPPAEAAPANPPPAAVTPASPPPGDPAPAALPLATAPFPPIPDLLLPHPPAVQPPPPVAEGPEPSPASPKPPKLSLTAALSPPPVTLVHEEEGPLSGQNRARLVKRLRGHPQQGIIIRAAAENGPAVKLAITLKSVFREAGWTVGEIEMITRPLPAHSLLLSTGVFPPPKEFVAAYAALAGTGFLVTSDLDPNQNRQRVVVSVGPIR